MRYKVNRKYTVKRLTNTIMCAKILATIKYAFLTEGIFIMESNGR